MATTINLNDTFNHSLFNINYTGDLILATHFITPNYFLIALYCVVVVAAFLGNTTLIIIVIKDKYMRSVTNYFLVNLAVADLFVTIVCMPNAAYNAYTALYIFPNYICKINGYLQCISVSSSIFTITTMAIDRYLVISRPFGLITRSLNKVLAIFIIAMLWIVSLILFYPMLQIYTLVPEDESYKIVFCAVIWTKSPISRHTLGTIWFLCMFAIPGLCIIFAYSMMGHTLCSVIPPMDSTQQRTRMMKSRKRAACILLFLTFVFAICWLPYHVVNLLIDTSTQEDISDSTEKFLLFLGHTNSALNPIIYCALSRKFRESLRDLCRVKIRLKRKPPIRQFQWDSSTSPGVELKYVRRVKELPNRVIFNNALSRMQQTSQKTTKTAVV